ncbi:MAG TPA: hypothetical protein VMW63_00370 [Methanoregulaceae archaeon]|nr:hypothetical protein [Methanoregulaceae archaeon]
MHPDRESSLKGLGYSLAHGCVPPVKKIPPHRLKSSSEVYVILQGRGRIHVGKEEAEVGPGWIVCPFGKIWDKEKHNIGQAK